MPVSVLVDNGYIEEQEGLDQEPVTEKGKNQEPVEAKETQKK